jgi:acyl-CoA synthetase (AMP-forming)/AMP-acid ligase II
MGLFTPNNIEVPVVNFAVHWAGGVASPANPTYTPEELAQQLKDSGAKALITQKPFLEIARKAAALVGLPAERILLLGEGRDETGVHRHWTDITAKRAKVQPQKAVIDPKKDLAYLVYSSVSMALLKVEATVTKGLTNPCCELGNYWIAQGRDAHPLQHRCSSHADGPRGKALKLRF